MMGELYRPPVALLGSAGRPVHHEEEAAMSTWRHRAACRDTDPELFHPVATTGPDYEAQVAAAKAVCGRCPVTADCLAEALDRIPHGIAGGLTEHERHALRIAAVT